MTAPRLTKSRRLSAIFVFAAVTFAVSPLIGPKLISPVVLWDSTSHAAAREILLQIRIPRVLLAFLAGSALAVSGLAFQAVFRNPLATPFTLGVSSGASLGAVTCLRLGLSFQLLGLSGVSIFALGGAVLSIIGVYSLTRTARRSTTATMLLAGVGASFCFSSVTVFLQYTADLSHSFQIVRWLMGGLEIVGYGSILRICPFLLVSIMIFLSRTKELDLLTTGEDLAASRGVDVTRTLRLVFFAASLTIGGVVSLCGPIGFVEIMVPHICRLLVGWKHGVLVPATIALGGAFLALCDVVARTVIAPVEIPVGVITAMLGGPFFLWLLIRGAGDPSGVSMRE